MPINRLDPTYSQPSNTNVGVNRLATQVSQPSQDTRSLADKIFSGLADVGKGVVKGVGSTVVGAAQLGNSLLRSTVGKGLEKVGIEPLPPIEKPEILKPEGTAQKVGFGLEQIGEFFIPGGAVTKATKGMGLVGKGLIEGAVAGGQTAIQEGEVGLPSLVTGGFASLFPVVGKVIKSLPENAWSGILKRKPSVVAKNPLLPKQAAETGIVGKNLESIKTQASNAIQEIEVRLDDILTPISGKLETSKIVDALNGLKVSYANIPGETGALNVIDNIAKDVVAKGESLSLVEANHLKRDIYKVIEKTYGKGFMDIPVKAESQKLIARTIKEEIEKIAPEIKDLNKQQAVYIQIKKAIDSRTTGVEGKGVSPIFGNIGLFDLLLGVGAGSVGYSQGGSEGLVTGLGLVAGKKLLQSPAFLSSIAKTAEYFNNLSPTKKALFYNGLKGLTGESAKGVSE